MHHLHDSTVNTDEVASLAFSPSALKALSEKQWIIKDTQVIQADLSWRETLVMGEEPHK